MGESIFIPASLGEYEIIGQLSLLKSYLPNIPKVESQILELLK